MKTRRFRRSPPDCDGWWLFREYGFSFDQEILIVDGMVADDYELANALGLEYEEIADSDRNYWEGNDPAEMVTGPLTSGMWKRDDK